MTATRGIARALLGIGALLVPAAAGAAQCQVTKLAVLVLSVGFTQTLDVPGLVFPVTIGSDGTFTLDASSFHETSFTINGVTSTLAFPAPTFTGTVDAGGNVQVPGVQMDFAVLLGDPLPPITLGAKPDLTSGISSVTIGKDWVTEGTPLDFTTGALSLQGHVIIPNPPVLGTAVSTGLQIDCVVSPLPDRSTLPAAAKLTGAHGTGKIVQDAGDTLKITARLVQGAHALDPATTDTFVRVRNEQGDDVVLVRVPAQRLAAKGKRLSLVDDDGSTLSVIEGRKTLSGTKVPTKGRAVLKRTKKAVSVALDVDGVDLAPLGTAAGTVSVLMGGVTASDRVKVVHRSSRIALK
jgi:hypothetical protein